MNVDHAHALARLARGQAAAIEQFLEDGTPGDVQEARDRMAGLLSDVALLNQQFLEGTMASRLAQLVIDSDITIVRNLSKMDCYDLSAMEEHRGYIRATVGASLLVRLAEAVGMRGEERVLQLLIHCRDAVPEQ